MAADAARVVSCIVQAKSDLTEQDMEDDGCKELLMTRVTTALEAHVLKKVDCNLTHVQKNNSVAAFFENTDKIKIQAETYQQIVDMIALAISEDADVETSEDGGSMRFKNDDAKAKCQHRAKQMTVNQLVLRLKASRLEETRNIDSLRKRLMMTAGEWGAKVTIADKLRLKGGKDSTVRNILGKLDTQKVLKSLATDPRQKLWMDLFGVLSPYMTALAFGADMTAAQGEGFDAAKTEFDAALDACLTKENEIQGYEALIQREKARLSALVAMKQREGDALKNTQEQLQSRLRSLDAEHSSLRTKVEEAKDSHWSFRIWFFGWNSKTDRSGERASLTQLMESNREQHRRTSESLAGLSPAKIEEELVNLRAGVQKTIDEAAGLLTKAQQELQNLSKDRDMKKKTFDDVTQAVATMLASTGACTREQALAGLQAAQALECAMGNASIETGVMVRLYKDMNLAIEMAPLVMEDLDLFDDFKQELNNLQAKPLIKMLDGIISITTLPLDYSEQLAKLGSLDPSVDPSPLAIEESPSKKARVEEIP